MKSKTRKSHKQNSKISVIVPTYNEKENITILVPKIFSSFDEINLNGEVIVVDDNSPDRTWEIVNNMKEKFNIKLIRRKRKLGLSSAVCDGIENASGDIIGVMDADLSHSPDVIPFLVKPILDGKTDVALASRYIDGGKTVNWSMKRKILSKGAGLFTKLLINLKDPMSGFFFFNKNILNNVSLKPSGYKIGLEIFVKGKYDEIKEIPYTFKGRKVGKSNLGMKENMSYIKHIAKLYWFAINR
ncbi:MAG: polyprenol monophosphomannose synthase [Candidatus Aenigmarchaeota archaeon]|nr:polyprenol monophosphomannose synthase [Candidatus Aenigmarchaeota archaeon]